MNDTDKMKEIDSNYTLADQALEAAVEAFHRLGDIHEAGGVPRGYSRSAADIKLYRDVAKLLELVKDAMGEEGITTQEDWKMTKAMECLGLTWR